MGKHHIVLRIQPIGTVGGLTHEQAVDKANDLDRHPPLCTGSDQFFICGGWRFDIGRKPYLVSYGDTIYRAWGRSPDDVRKGLRLPHKARVAPDPFDGR